MKILFLSEDSSVFDENSVAQAKVLEYASLASMFFIIVATQFNKKSNVTKKISSNAWMYRTNSAHKFSYIYDIYKLASFEIKDRNIFQADVIVCDGQFTSAVAGYFLSRKFKRPLYVFLSDTAERKFLAPVGLKNFLLSKIIWFVLVKADYIEVNNFGAKERLRKKIALKNHTIQVIKPFLEAEMLLASSKMADGKREDNNFLRKKFPEFKFMIVAFVDNVEQVELSLNILKKLNEHFPPASLVFLPSYNIKNSRVARLIKRNMRNWVRVENIDENLCEYLSSSNVFWGLSEGEKYEEVLSKACAVGSTIIALEGGISSQFIDDNVTGLICPQLGRKETVDYFVDKTFFLMSHPSSSIGFKINSAIYFKQHFTASKKEFLNKLKLSWKECVDKYEKSKLKFYRY